MALLSGARELAPKKNKGKLHFVVTSKCTKTTRNFLFM